MILEDIASDRRNLTWAIAHGLLGVFCTLTPVVLIIWFYFVFLTNIFLLKNKNIGFYLIFFSYLLSFELLCRMAKTSPLIPYEIGKYFLLLMAFIGLVIYGSRSLRGVWMAFLISPALFYDFSGIREFNDIIFNYFGPLSLSLGIAFVDRLVISGKELNQILKFLWLGCLSSLLFCYIKTPDFESISFGLKANFQTTGGHASNQVSTILGLGMFLSFYSLYKRLNFSGSRLFDSLALAGFAFQGLLTFSRGGILVALFGVLLLILLPENNLGRRVSMLKHKFLFFGIFGFFALYGVFRVANSLTGGFLLLRYQGQTAGTLDGSKEASLDHLTTGRLGVLEGDVDLWRNYLVTGVGVGSSAYMREGTRENLSAHVELSRLLAEHGIFGLVFALVLFIVIPLKAWRSNVNSSSRIILITLIVIAILTTFHAAMRTFVSPFFMILGGLQIVDSKNNSIKVLQRGN